MLWVVQQNLFNERQYEAFIDVLDRAQLDYQVVKVIPFGGGMEPEVIPEGRCIVYGSVGLSKIAQERSWIPGSYMNELFDVSHWMSAYGKECLNWGSRISRFDQVEEQSEPFFIRPCLDDKSFGGTVFETWEEFQVWQNKVIALKETYTTLDGSTMVAVAPAQNVAEEYRCWIVSNPDTGRHEVVTASRYARNRVLSASPHVDEEILAYAEERAHAWAPADAFVLDIARLADHSMRVVEINCICGSGLYEANVSKMIQALNYLGDHS